MDHSYLISFLDKRSIPIITRKRRTYLAYFGLEQEYTYVLREGVVKTSVILRDGREFNISYIKGPDIISLLRDEVSSYTSAPFNVRVESESASFYRIPRVKFWNYVNGDAELQKYVKEYYRASLAAAAAHDNERQDRRGLRAAVHTGQPIRRGARRRLADRLPGHQRGHSGLLRHFHAQQRQPHTAPA